MLIINHVTFYFQESSAACSREIVPVRSFPPLSRDFLIEKCENCLKRFRAAGGGTAASTGTISRPEWTRFLLKCHVLLLASLTILNKTVTFGVARAAGRGCGLTRSGPRPAGASFTAAFCSSRCACARACVRGVEVEGSVASSHVTSPPVLPALGPDLFVVVAARL